MLPAVSTLMQFVEGDIDASAFETILYREGDLEAMLSAERAPRYARDSATLYHFLIGLDYNDPGDVLNAQSALGDFLQAQGFDAVASEEQAGMVELLLSAQPKWLDMDLTYVREIAELAPSTLTRGALKKWVHQELLRRFRSAKSPPRWLQSPAWPLGSNGPLVFLGQIAVPDFFHDEAVAYVFYDADTKSTQTVLQMS